MPTFKVWLATDTLLYLPIYALADMGVLARVAATVGFGSEIKIEIQTSPKPGDRAAIEHMRDEASKNEEGVVHIAIGDPAAAFLVDRCAADIALLGAIIKKPSFWLLGRQLPPNVRVEHRYVYYQDRYATGSFLGRQIASSAGCDRVDQCEMGAEFAELFKEESIPGELRVLTADIVGLATVQEQDRSIEVIEALGTSDRFDDFVTVGILTHSKYLKAQKQHVSLFLEAVRSACVLLGTAEKPAAALIRELIEKGAESKQAMTDVPGASPIPPEAIAAKIASRLFHDRVYSDTLAVTPSEWKGAVDARYPDPKTRAKADALFLSIYKPNIADILTGKWLTNTFRDYGRFVQGIRVLKYSTGAALFAMLMSQVLLRMAYVSDSPNWLSRSTPEALYLSSIFIALISATWLSFAFVTAGTARLRPLARLGYYLINKAGLLGLPIFTIVLMATLLATLHYGLGAAIALDNVVLGLTPFFAASLWPGLNALLKRRHA